MIVKGLGLLNNLVVILQKRENARGIMSRNGIVNTVLGTENARGIGTGNEVGIETGYMNANGTVNGSGGVNMIASMRGRQDEMEEEEVMSVDGRSETTTTIVIPFQVETGRWRNAWDFERTL